VTLALVILVIAVALAFDYTNGFHDAANAIATAVSTRALPLRVALPLAALLNLLGALLGQGVAKTIGSGIISPPDGQAGLIIVLAGLLGAIAWNLVTWLLGWPSSSSHALIGGLTGAGLASATTVHWSVIVDKVLIPMVISPLVGFGLAYSVMVLILWVFRRSNAHRTTRRFRLAQIFSASALALGHGLQDAQKTMGVIVLALAAGGYATRGEPIPLWVVLSAATAISLGTWSGGLRIMRTLGRRVIQVDPPRGFAAESSAAAVLYTTAFVFAAPISTTHTTTSAILGVGATRRFSAVRWGLAGDIATGWVLTIPAAASTAALIYWALSLVL
jgi:PiT family inorganic phosphate transporter